MTPTDKAGAVTSLLSVVAGAGLPLPARLFVTATAEEAADAAEALTRHGVPFTPVTGSGRTGVEINAGPVSYRLVHMPEGAPA